MAIWKAVLKLSTGNFYIINCFTATAMYIADELQIILQKIKHMYCFYTRISLFNIDPACDGTLWMGCNLHASP